MNQDAEIIRRLVAAHDPAAGLIAADAHADLQGHATLERILATPTAKTGRAGRAGRRWWPYAILPSVVWAAIAVTFVLLVVRTVDSGSPALAATPSPLAYHLPEKAPTGRELLLQLAAVAAHEPVRTRPDEAYAYVRTAGWYLDTQARGNQANSKVVASVRESWIAANGFDRWITRRVPGNGSHVSVTAIGPQTGQDAGAGPRRLRLSTIPAVIAHQLDIGHPRTIGPVERFVSLTDLALNQPISPRAQSAILRVLAGSPGLIDSGKVTDRAGRPGVAVSLDSAYSGLPTRYTLIFNPDTSSLLGEEQTLLGNPGKLHVPPKSVIAYTAFLASDYVASPTARP
ncbi:MAG TPA: CU044_5270 family protein [Solirubrobacteraceae bacterium]